MATIITTSDELVAAVNAGGFQTLDQFVKFLNIGRLQSEIGAYEVANKALDASTAATRQENEAQKQENNAAITERQTELAALVNS